MGQKHFASRHDLVIGPPKDGFSPFKHHKYSAWPLLVYNYNLPPNILFHHEKVICVSIIPGPHSVKSLNSFIEPLICELECLKQGVRAFDATTQTMFTLCGHVLAPRGDQPAIAKWMMMKGHNAVFPC